MKTFSESGHTAGCRGWRNNARSGTNPACKWAVRSARELTDEKMSGTRAGKRCATNAPPFSVSTEIMAHRQTGQPQCSVGHCSTYAAYSAPNRRLMMFVHEFGPHCATTAHFLVPPNVMKPQHDVPRHGMTKCKTRLYQTKILIDGAAAARSASETDTWRIGAMIIRRRPIRTPTIGPRTRAFVMSAFAAMIVTE